MSGRGSPPGVRQGGRAPGTPNKATRLQDEARAKYGMTPLEYMLSVMHESIPDDADTAERNRLLSIKLDAAKSAAPYMHPRLNTTTVQGGDKPLQVAVAVYVPGKLPPLDIPPGPKNG